jgi:hypothetical protein
MNIYEKINNVRKEVDYIQKDKAVSTGGGSYQAVTHDAVTALLRKHLIEQGIVCIPNFISSISNPKEEGAKQFRYSATYSFDFVNAETPAERITIVIEAHAMDNADKAPGKAISYAKKYAVLKLFEIETGEDEESRYQEPEYITGEQSKAIAGMIADKNADAVKFCEYFKIEAIEKMPAKRFEEAVKLLKAKKKAEKAAPVKKAEEDLKEIIRKKNEELGVDREPGDEAA